MYRRMTFLAGTVAAAAVSALMLPVRLPAEFPYAGGYVGKPERKPVRQLRRTRPLNRSRHWHPAMSYEHARTMAPPPHCDRPVR